MMLFKDEYEESSFHFILDNLFYREPAGVRSTGDFAGEEYDEYWWKDCILRDGEYPGTQGYLVVWFRDGELNTHHTYRNPKEMF